MNQIIEATCLSHSYHAFFLPYLGPTKSRAKTLEIQFTRRIFGLNLIISSVYSSNEPRRIGASYGAILIIIIIIIIIMIMIKMIIIIIIIIMI